MEVIFIYNITYQLLNVKMTKNEFDVLFQLISDNPTELYTILNIIITNDMVINRAFYDDIIMRTIHFEIFKNEKLAVTALINKVLLPEYAIQLIYRLTISKIIKIINESNENYINYESIIYRAEKILYNYVDYFDADFIDWLIDEIYLNEHYKLARAVKKMLNNLTINQSDKLNSLLTIDTLKNY